MFGRINLLKKYTKPKNYKKSIVYEEKKCRRCLSEMTISRYCTECEKFLNNKKEGKHG